MEKEEEEEEKGASPVPVVSQDDDSFDDDDDFGDFEEADEDPVQQQQDEEKGAIGLSEEAHQEDERIVQYMTTTLTPDEYEDMFRADLKALGMGWNCEDARSMVREDPLCQKRFIDLEGPDMYGDLLVLKKPEPTEEEKDPMKMSRDIRVKVLEDLVGFPLN